MSDMEVDSSDEIDSVYDDLQSFELNSNKWESNKIWNGREVFFLKFMEEKEEILKIIRSVSILKPRPLQTREIEQLNFDEREDELDTVEDLLTENDYEFDTDLGVSEDCKSVKAHLKHAVKATKKAVKKTGKAVEKCAKKVAKVSKKAVDEVCDFVTEHKKELIIAAAVIAAAVIAAATLGTGPGAGAAAVGAAGGLASDKKKEDDDSPNPEGTDTESSGSPDPEPFPPHSIPDRKITEFSNPISVPPLPVIKSPFANFLESLNRDKISPETSIPNPSFPVFNHRKVDDHFFNHKNDHLQTEAIPIPPAQTALSHFLETLRLGAEIIGRGMCEPELLNPNSPLDHFFKSDPDNSTPPTGQTIANFFQTIEDTLSKGLEAIGRCYNPFDLFNKPDIDKQKSAIPLPENTTLSTPNAFASPNAFINFSKALSGFPEALAPEITLPDNSTGQSTPPTGPTITTFFQTIQDTLSKGLEAIGRSYNPFDLFNKTDIDKQKSDIPLPENIAIPMPNAFANAFTNFSKALSGVPEVLAPEIPSPNEFSRLYKTEGVSRDDMCITYINGINTSPEEALANAEHIRKFMPGNLCINGIYNHSNNFVTDLLEVFLFNYLGFSPNTQELLMQSFTEFHEKNKDNPNQKLFHFCSSQGGIHTKNSLTRLPDEIRNRVIVINIGTAASVPNELCYRSYNYASMKDFMHYGEYIFTHLIAASNNESERHELLSMLAENRRQLILLEPHEDAKGIDHSPQSPTFDETYRRQLKDYFAQEGVYP